MTAGADHETQQQYQWFAICCKVIIFGTFMICTYVLSGFIGRLLSFTFSGLFQWQLKLIEIAKSNTHTQRLFTLETSTLQFKT